MCTRYTVLVVLIMVAGCAGITDGQSHKGAGEEDLAPGPGNDGGVLPAPDLAPALDLAPTPDLVPLKEPGEECTTDAECQTGLCRDVLGDGKRTCVRACKTQAECMKLVGTYCAPTGPGAAEGYCAPHSPSHCSSCKADAECGVLGERCMQAPGDIAAACHIDCSLAGAAACPPDYLCMDIMDGGTARKLCVPEGKVCLDALGGYCDRVTSPRSCVRANAAGTCVGQRVCLPSKRYDRCNAMAPQFKRSCTDLDPAGCMLAFSPEAATTRAHCGLCGRSCGANEECCDRACKPLDTVMDCGACGRACAGGHGCCAGLCTPLDTPQNCGACGNVCPGMGLGNNDVTCADPAAHRCGMSCRGENYDVDNNPANGCERLDPVPPGHEQPSAAYRGSKECYDGSSTDSFGSTVLSDSREHRNPAISSFVGWVGAAPDYWRVFADGGLFCQNDYEVSVSTRGGGSTPCYQLTIITNKKTASVVVSGSGSASMSSGAGSYSDDTDIYFKIEKICNLPIQEAVNYTVRYHL